MINQLFKKISLILTIVMSVGITIPAFAQSIVKGNIINQVYTLRQRDGAFIMIKGTLEPSQLDQVRIEKSSDKEFTITIPNAIINPEKFKNRILTFDQSQPLASIAFDEKMIESDDDTSFQLNLNVTGQKVYDIEVMKPATSSLLRVKLIDTEAIQKRQAEEAKMIQESEKIKEDEQTREMAKTEKQQVDTEQEQTMVEMKKSVDAMLQKFRRPSIMQLSIINASGWQKRAYKLSVYLGKEKLKHIEESLGVKLDIVNISNAKDETHAQSTIYFRDNFLKPALFLAGLIPGEQKLVPINDQRERLGVDIEIYLGKDYK